jgi:hypothetical protein
MFSAPWPVSRSCAVVLILLALCYVLTPPCAIAAPGDGVAASTCAARAGPVVGSIYEVMGNRTRMIQVAAVLGAIGIFFLTRHYRN